MLAAVWTWIKLCIAFVLAFGVFYGIYFRKAREGNRKAYINRPLFVILGFVGGILGLIPAGIIFFVMLLLVLWLGGGGGYQNVLWCNVIVILTVYLICPFTIAGESLFLASREKRIRRRH